MNENVNTSGWERPVRAPELGTGRIQADIDKWWVLIDRVAEIALANGWTKADVGRRAGMASGTFSQWFSGKYAGRYDQQNDIISRWLEAAEEQSGVAAAMPMAPGFLKLKTTIDIISTLRWAQMAPDLVAITLAAGNGKTFACRHYAAVTPHVFMATISPNNKTVHGMLVELCAALNIDEHNPAKFTRAIGRRLERLGSGTLLIIDEAQHLIDESVNQLRYFLDVNSCGIALVGNEEVYDRFTKKTDGPSYAQLKSRIGRRLKLDKPKIEDIQAYIAAWGIADPECVKYLVGVAAKGGALRQIEKTLKQAIMYSIGDGVDVTIQHIRAAWKNRDVEDLS
jgi:DNA transposition AAA+ family ATPase